MRRDLLKAAEREFFAMYPGGFSDPEMEEIKKKHRIKKMHDQTCEYFGKSQFSDIEETTENIVRIVTRSSLVSVFEKTKFRDFARALSLDDKRDLTQGLKQMLHGNKEKGFEEMTSLLSKGKLAKWPIVSVIPYYFKPQEEVLIKPTTVKGIIKTFELEGLKYHPYPTYEFYMAYKERLKEMQKVVDKSLSEDNAAFSGFLMMMMDSNRGK